MNKRLAVCLMTACACAVAADLRVDHVTIAGRDLKDLRAKFAAAGIRTEYGGKHTNGMTEMALASFADGSYLELMAAQDPRAGAAKHYWGKFIDGDAGPCAWAIAVDDLDVRAKKLGSQITQGGRKRPDGVELKWHSAAVGPEAQHLLSFHDPGRDGPGATRVSERRPDDAGDARRGGGVYWRAESG